MDEAPNVSIGDTFNHTSDGSALTFLGGKERRTWRERIPIWLIQICLVVHIVWIALDMHYMYYYSALWGGDLVVFGFAPILLLDLFLIYLTIDEGERKSE